MVPHLILFILTQSDYFSWQTLGIEVDEGPEGYSGGHISTPSASNMDSLTWWCFQAGFLIAPSLVMLGVSSLQVAKKQICHFAEDSIGLGARK